MRAGQGWLVLTLLLVIVICAAILLIDRFYVRKNQPDPEVAAREALVGFEEVDESERVDHAERLLAGFAPLLEIEGARVYSMLRRVQPEGVVWAFELEFSGELLVPRAKYVWPPHDFEVNVLQPIIAVEARGLGASDAGEGMPLWFALRRGDIGGGRSVWADVLQAEFEASERRVQAAEAIVAVSREPVPAAELIEGPAGARMGTWPDVLFAGAGDRLVAAWPRPDVSLPYWADRTTNPAMVPSITASGFQWDLQRVVDIANFLIEDPEQHLSRVVEIDFEAPKIELPELDLTSGIDEIAAETRRKNEQVLRDFEQSSAEILEQGRRRQAEILEEGRRQRAEIRERMRRNLEELRAANTADSVASENDPEG